MEKKNFLNIACAAQPFSQPNAETFSQQYFGSKQETIMAKYPITIETNGDEHEYPSEERNFWQFPPLSGVDSTVVNRRKGEINSNKKSILISLQIQNSQLLKLQRN